MSARAGAVIALSLAAVLGAGCGSGDIAPEKRLEAWLGEVCGDAAIAKQVEGADPDVAAAGGTPVAAAGCMLEDETVVEAYIFERDPSDELLDIADGAESGDGASSVYQVSELDDGQWGAVFAFTEDTGLLDELEDDADASWERHSSAS